jgi:uncharacterized protein YidB (DUF937 family)
MARGAFPSMTALLGLLAVAGYQNRDKLAELLGNRAGAGSNDGRPDRPAGLDSLLGGLGGAAGGSGFGSILGGGLKELTDRFRQNGQAETVESWVGPGPNKTVPESDIERAVGADVIDELVEHTGLSRSELLARLTRELPGAVDKYTPQGRVPDDDDIRGWSTTS